MKSIRTYLDLLSNNLNLYSDSAFNKKWHYKKYLLKGIFIRRYLKTMLSVELKVTLIERYIGYFMQRSLALTGFISDRLAFSAPKTIPLKIFYLLPIWTNLFLIIPTIVYLLLRENCRL